MRRKDREITDRAEMLRILERCDVCRVALNGDDGYPYILPLNYGVQVEGDQVTLVFHGALTGTKYDLMARDGRAVFEVDGAHRLVTEQKEACVTCTMEYESVIGRGRMELVPDEEKHEALRALMCHYHGEDLPFSETIMGHTAAFRLVVEEMTGKKRMKPGS